MLGTIFVIAIIVLVIANLGGQAAATAQLKRDSAESMRIADENWERFERKLAKESDTYYSSYCKSRNDWFWSDGSLKRDPHTGKTYPKGQYRATTSGIDCNMRKVGPDVKRPPRN